MQYEGQRGKLLNVVVFLVEPNFTIYTMKTYSTFQNIFFLTCSKAQNSHGPFLNIYPFYK